MKIRTLLAIGLLFAGYLAIAQDVNSARSSSPLRLEFKSAPATITWVEPAEFSTNVKDKVFTLKIGIDSETDILDALIYVNDLAQELEVLMPLTSHLIFLPVCMGPLVLEPFMAFPSDMMRIIGQIASMFF